MGGRAMRDRGKKLNHAACPQKEPQTHRRIVAIVFCVACSSTSGGCWVCRSGRWLRKTAKLQGGGTKGQCRVERGAARAERCLQQGTFSCPTNHLRWQANPAASNRTLPCVNLPPSPRTPDSRVGVEGLHSVVDCVAELRQQPATDLREGRRGRRGGGEENRLEGRRQGEREKWGAHLAPRAWQHAGSCALLAFNPPLPASGVTCMNPATTPLCMNRYLPATHHQRGGLFAQRRGPRARSRAALLICRDPAPGLPPPAARLPLDNQPPPDARGAACTTWARIHE